jgi:hypothetical protein
MKMKMIDNEKITKEEKEENPENREDPEAPYETEGKEPSNESMDDAPSQLSNVVSGGDHMHDQIQIEKAPSKDEDRKNTEEEEDPPINYKFYNIDGAPTQKNQARKRGSLDPDTCMEKNLSRRRLLSDNLSIQVPGRVLGESSCNLNTKAS